MANEGSDEEKRPAKSSDDQPDPFPSDYPDIKPYAFSSHVVIGIAIVLAAAAGATIFAMTVSQSPQISLSPEEMSASLAATAQETAEKNNDRELVLIADDFGWNGTENGPVIRVTKGETIQLTVVNAGKMAHNFGIAKVSLETRRAIDGMDDMPLADRLNHISYDDMSAHPCPGCEEIFHDAHIMRFIMPGEQHLVTFTADQEGEFKYFCMVRGHLWLGMNGNIIVESEKGITGPEPEIVQGGEES